jgi:hypothetical protein
LSVKGVDIATDEAMTSPLAFVSATRFSATEFDVTHASAGTAARFYRYGNAGDAGEISKALGWVMDNQQYPQTLEPTRGSLSIRPITTTLNGQALTGNLTTLP